MNWFYEGNLNFIDKIEGKYATQSLCKNDTKFDFELHNYDENEVKNTLTTL